MHAYAVDTSGWPRTLRSANAMTRRRIVPSFRPGMGRLSFHFGRRKADCFITASMTFASRQYLAIVAAIQASDSEADFPGRVSPNSKRALNARPSGDISIRSRTAAMSDSDAFVVCDGSCPSAGGTSPPERYLAWNAASSVVRSGTVVEEPAIMFPVIAKYRASE